MFISISGDLSSHPVQHQKMLTCKEDEGKQIRINSSEGGDGKELLQE